MEAVAYGRKKVRVAVKWDSENSCPVWWSSRLLRFLLQSYLPILSCNVSSSSKIFNLSHLPWTLVLSIYSPDRVSWIDTRCRRPQLVNCQRLQISCPPAIHGLSLSLKDKLSAKSLPSSNTTVYANINIGISAGIIKPLWRPWRKSWTSVELPSSRVALLHSWRETD
jgi:hypothetical protein